jgi:hypothetical protein
MHYWTRRLLAVAAPLLLTGCLWGPGKFSSDLTLRKDGSFVLDYRGQIVLEVPPDDNKPTPWKDSMAQCHRSGRVDWIPDVPLPVDTAPGDPIRPCSAAEIAQAKSKHEQSEAAAVAQKRKDNEKTAAMFGLPGFDDATSRVFADKMMKYAGWRSVTYRGNGVFDVDYHMEGRLTQDFAFPMMPDSNIVIPFIAMRRRADGAVLVNAPALTGGMNMFGPMAQQMGGDSKQTPPSRAEGRFTVHTDGQIVTNNSEDGPSADPLGRQVHWDIAPGSNKVPETLVRL